MSPKYNVIHRLPPTNGGRGLFFNLIYFNWRLITLQLLYKCALKMELFHTASSSGSHEPLSLG